MSEIVQIKEGDWDEVANPKYIATLPLTAKDLEVKFNFEILEYWDDGLGQARACMVAVDSSKYFLNSHPGGGVQISDHMSVEVRSFEPDTSIALSRLLQSLHIGKEALLDCIDELGPAKWLLYRIDDNENEIEMYRFHEKWCAEAVAERFEKRGHKQLYVVTKAT